jgi:hypothetical protein
MRSRAAKVWGFFVSPVTRWRTAAIVGAVFVGTVVGPAVAFPGGAGGEADSFAPLAVATGPEAYAAVWQPGSGTQWWRSGMTVDAFKAQDKVYFDRGLRLTSLAIRNGRFTAVWRPGSGTQWWRSGMTVDQFKAQDTAYFNQGLRITALEIENGRFAAVWRPGSGTQWWRSAMSSATFAAWDRVYFGRGLRLAVLEIANGTYTAVWRPGSGTQWWSARRCAVDFGTEDAAYFGRGLRLAFIELQDNPVGAYRYPWKSGVSYGVGQGNNNPAGSHNGSQAFAFDFLLPAGTTIRAARAGTVEWLQENLTRTYNPNLPNSPSNTPFAAGSLDNWGNAVRIRHPGGFTSWYFHIQTNGVLVNVGDTVQQGQPIATSGNTGRSTGAHLHYQVQADSTDWGQSVASTFGTSCAQPATNATATSDNSNSNFP